ncbi:hypothetical protein HDU82_003349 [Entophlyctis luteolus]|nr:hypothetical protein HDU82_003349 [Entophlyctis luteolus]
MSQLIFRRFKSSSAASILPPPVSSLKELGRLQSVHPQAHPELFGQMKSFYKNIPKGPKPASAVHSLRDRYYDAYLKKDSFVPVLHFLAVLVPTGYYFAYFKGGHYHPTSEFH